MSSRDSGVRQAAAGALGAIYPEPAPATQALAGLLAEPDVETRRAAAAALARMLRTVIEVLRTQLPNAVVTTPAQAVATATAVVPVAGRGLKDADAQVRQSCAEALQLAARILGEPPVIIELPESQRAEFPPPGRKLTAAEQADIDRYRKDVLEERGLCLPLARALNAQVPPLLPCVADDELTVRLQAAGALEDMAQARSRLLAKAASVPQAGGEQDLPRLQEDPLGPGLRSAVPVLAKQLTHAEVRARLAVIYALETLGPDAAAAAAPLARARSKMKTRSCVGVRPAPSD